MFSHKYKTFSAGNCTKQRTERLMLKDWTTIETRWHAVVMKCDESAKASDEIRKRGYN